jgi:hypothetical protein
MPRIVASPEIKIFRLQELSAAWEMAGKIFLGEPNIPEYLAKESEILHPQIQIFENSLGDTFQAASVYPDFVRVLINDVASYYSCSPVSYDGKFTAPIEGIELKKDDNIHEIISAFHALPHPSQNNFIPVRPAEFLDGPPSGFDKNIHSYYPNMFGHIHAAI